MTSLATYHCSHILFSAPGNPGGGRCSPLYWRGVILTDVTIAGLSGRKAPFWGRQSVTGLAGTWYQAAGLGTPLVAKCAFQHGSTWCVPSPTLVRRPLAVTLVPPWKAAEPQAFCSPPSAPALLRVMAAWFQGASRCRSCRSRACLNTPVVRGPESSDYHPWGENTWVIDASCTYCYCEGVESADLPSTFSLGL